MNELETAKNRSATIYDPSNCVKHIFCMRVDPHRDLMSAIAKIGSLPNCCLCECVEMLKWVHFYLC